MCFSEPIFYRKQSLGAPDKNNYWEILGKAFVSYIELCRTRRLSSASAPPGTCTWKIALKYKVKQSKNDKFTPNYKASPIDFETQISLRR